MDDELLARAAEDPDALAARDWDELEAALVADPAARARLARLLTLDDRLARCLDRGRGSVAAAVRWRLDHGSVSGRFVRRVLACTRPLRRRRWAAAAAALIALAVGWVIAAHARERKGPGLVELTGAQATLASDAVLRGGRRPDLIAGRAEFSVDPHPAADPFILVVPHATITVLGTRFAVVAGERTTVDVTRGRVRIAAGDARLELGAGERAIVGGAEPPTPTRRTLLLLSAADPSRPPASGVAVAGVDGPELASVDLPEDYCGVRARIPDDAPEAVARPGLRVLVRYRVARPVPDVRIQCGNRDRGINFTSRALPAEPGRWHEVELPLAELKPVDGSGPWREGERAHDVLLYTAGHLGDALRVVEIGLTEPR